MDWSSFYAIIVCLGLVAFIFISCLVTGKIVDRLNQRYSCDLEAAKKPSSRELYPIQSINWSPLSSIHPPLFTSTIASLTNVSLEDSFNSHEETQSLPNLSLQSLSSVSSIVDPILISQISSPKNKDYEHLSTIRSSIKPQLLISTIASLTNESLEDSDNSYDETESLPDLNLQSLSSVSSIVNTKLISQISSPRKKDSEHISPMVSTLKDVRRDLSSVTPSIACQDYSYDEKTVIFDEETDSLKTIVCISSEQIKPFRKISSFQELVSRGSDKKERSVSWPQASSIYNTFVVEEPVRYPSMISFSSHARSCDRVCGQNILISGGIGNYLKQSAIDDGLKQIVKNPL